MSRLRSRILSHALSASHGRAPRLSRPPMLDHELFGCRRDNSHLLIAIVEIRSSQPTLSASLVRWESSQARWRSYKWAATPAGLTSCHAIDLHLKSTFFASGWLSTPSTFRPRTLKFLPSSALKYPHEVPICVDVMSGGSGCVITLRLSHRVYHLALSEARPTSVLAAVGERSLRDACGFIWLVSRGT